MFDNIFSGSTQVKISPVDFLLCIAVSLAIGLILALVYTFRSKYTKSFVTTLAMIPAVVCVVIMLVNGNLGAGVAVAGAFSLVRFRSAPGTAKEIGAIFLAMGAGLAAGMGYIGFAVAFTLVLGAANMLYVVFEFGTTQRSCERLMRITIPEDLDYNGIFDDLLQKYTKRSELLAVKTTNMGSLFKLTYDITLLHAEEEKKFIDELRCRNGNLEISISMHETAAGEL
ncbi:MAG: DUF4956 domain-containing protein [Clostridia bacterium]